MSGDPATLRPTEALEQARAQWRALAPLIAGTPRVRLGVRTARGLLEYRTRDERPLSQALPSAPAAVRVYGPDGCCAALCLDLDASRGGPGAVQSDAQRLSAWLTRHGARHVTDVSPSGGVHIYVPIAGRIPYDTAREVVEALAASHPTLDAGPHRSLKTGCIRPPGSAHKAGGHQELTMPLGAAYDVLRRSNPPQVLTALRGDLKAAIAAWRTAQVAPQSAALEENPNRRLGQLSTRLRLLAETGLIDPSRYTSPSEARQAVIAGAVAAGWTLADVAARLADGRWPGLASLYARYSPTQRHRALARDWHGAQRFITTAREHPRPATGKSAVRISHTSAPKTHGGPPAASSAQSEHEHIRTWRTALRVVEQGRFPGRAGYLKRFVLRALGEAAHKSGSRYVAFGTRSLAVATGADHSTVAGVLRALAAEPGGWIDLVNPARGENADLYELTLPKDLAENAPDLRWDKGKAHALRPVFRTLGPVAALVFEAIENDRAHTVTSLVSATGIARSSVHLAVDTLAAHGLVERQDGRLVPLPHNLLRAAEQLGVLEDVVTQLRRYAQDRARWHAYLARHEPHQAPGDPAEDYWWPPEEDVGWTLLDSLAA
ncbi:helix-turn-helix domain-containing protein [Actinotalea sp. K2]|uniref:helix-turn-helix domain-containing protein n=1 Tax=Actinotalea sp. K2 TaxID=2939438 RepID=UPI0020183DA0|nr:helix-turn-helix domain-containing protein [Actinotalea sp. K2]MCL3863020.1 helix-turn-helix domain-containing protein [Actinotalea sp. K2]